MTRNDDSHKAAPTTCLGGSALRVAGMLVGMSVAVSQAVTWKHHAPSLAVDAVATVNGQPIARERLERHISAINAAGESIGSEQETESAILERLIDEELLVQRAIEIGAAESDTRLRGELVRVALEHSKTASTSSEIHEHTLRAYYDENSDRFRPAQMVHVRRWEFPNSTAEGATLSETQAQTASAELNADPSAAHQRREFEGSPESARIPVPDVLMPMKTLADYLTANELSAVSKLEVRRASAPLAGKDGFSVVQVLDRRESVTPSFDSIREHVEARYRRDLNEANFRELLKRLRNQSRIRIRPALD